jgi:hypothetical protein
MMCATACLQAMLLELPEEHCFKESSGTHISLDFILVEALDTKQRHCRLGRQFIFFTEDFFISPGDLARAPYSFQRL